MIVPSDQREESTRSTLIIIGLLVIFLPAAALGQEQTPTPQIHTGTALEFFSDSNGQALEINEQSTSSSLTGSIRVGEADLLQETFLNNPPMISLSQDFRESPPLFN